MDKRHRQKDGPRGKGGAGGNGGKGDNGKTDRDHKNGKDRKGKGMMPPPDRPGPGNTDDPNKIIGNNASSVRRCDRQGVTHKNPTKDTYMAVGKRMLKYSDAVKMFPGKCISSMMSTFKAPHNFRFSVCLDHDHNRESIRKQHRDFKSHAHKFPAGYEATIKQLFV